MKTKRTNTEYWRKMIARRLQELLKLRNMTQSELLRKSAEYDPCPMTRQQLSQIIHAKRSLVPYHANIFSSALEIEPGYLLGSDDFRASDYSEFVDFYGSGYKKTDAAFRKYDYLLNMIGYKVIGMTQINDTVIDYDILHRDITACIPKEQVEQFVDDVKKYMRLRIAPLMELYKKD